MGNTNTALTAKDILKGGKVKKLLPDGIDRYNTIHDYPIAYFPNELKCIIDTIEDVKNIAPDYSGTVILSVIGMLATNKFMVVGADGWEQHMNLYTLLYGNSAAAKSQAYYTFLDHLIKMDARKYDEWQAADKEHKKRIAEAKGTGDTYNDEAPQLRQYIITGGTIEGIRESLKTYGAHPLYLFPDEAANFFGGLNKYNGGSDDKTAFLAMYDGKGFKLATKTNGLSGSNGACLSFGATVQPAVINKVIGKDMDGLSFRLTTAFANRDDKVYRGVPIATNTLMQYENMIDRIISIEYEYSEYSNHPTPKKMYLSAGAKEAYLKYAEFLSAIINKEKEAYVADLIKRQRGNCYKLAGIMQLMYYLLHEDDSYTVSERAMQAAIELTDYYISVSIKMHEDIINPDKGKGFYGWRKELYEALPDNFTKAQALEIGARIGVSDRSISTAIKDTAYNNLKHGNYEKA